MKAFFLLWIGQLLSVIGSQMTGFALGIWIYQRTQSTTLFALMAVLYILPNILLMPLAGILADRWNRRRVMLLSDLGSGLTTIILAIGLILTSHALPISLIGVLIFLNSSCGSLLRPAYTAAVSQLVPPQELGRASGMLQVSYSLSQLLAPMLGSAILTSWGLYAVLGLDCLTFMVAILAQLCVRIPPIPPRTLAVSLPFQGSWLYELKEAYEFLTYRPGLFGLLLFFTAKNLLTSMSQVIITPYILSFASANDLAAVLSGGGVGMVVGSVVVGVLPERGRSRIRTIFWASLFSGFVLFLAAKMQSIPSILLASFLFFLALPFIHASGQVIFHHKIPLDIQGKVFALNEALAGASIPLGYLLAGPLTDVVFEPMMAPGGFLVPVFGPWLGVGSGRGLALFFVVLGFLHCLCAVFVKTYSPIQSVEWKLPNTVRFQTVNHHN